MSEKVNFFNLPEEKVVIRPNLEKRANEIGLLINPDFNHKIEWSENHGGRCMCDWKNRKCPCSSSQIYKDLVDYDGQCLCGVLITDEKLKKTKLKKDKKKIKNTKQKSNKKSKQKEKEAKELAKKLGCKNC